MTLTTEQQKWLTEEFLGLCWHELDYDRNAECTKCGKLVHFASNIKPSLDFTDWRTFGILWNKMQKHERWEEFLYDHLKVLGAAAMAHYVNPTRFALAIYEFFNGGQPRPSRKKKPGEKRRLASNVVSTNWRRWRGKNDLLTSKAFCSRILQHHALRGQ